MEKTEHSTKEISQNGNHHDMPGLALVNGHPKNDAVAEVLVSIRKNLRLLLAAGLTAFVISFLCFHFFHIKHYSRVTFLVDDSDPSEISFSEPERLILSQVNALSNKRMQMFIYSDEMARRLDEQIEIGKHYGLLKDDNSYYDRIINKLQQHVEFSQGDNGMRIEAGDRDKYYAPLLANTIYENLVKMNRDIAFNLLKYKLGIYQVNVEQFENEKKMEIERFMYAINKLPEVNQSSQRDADYMYFLKRDLSEMFIQYSNTSSELHKNQLIYKLTTGAIRDTTIQNMFIIRKAYPSSLQNAYVRAGIFSSGIAVCIMTYTFLIIYLSSRYKNYLRIFTARKLPPV